MNSYIINPIWFYLIDVCGTLKDVAGGVVIGGGIALVVALVAYCIAYSEVDDYYDVEDGKALLNTIGKFIKIMVIILIISIILAIFIPSETTLIEMMVAKLATYSSIEAIGNSLKDACDYIINSIATLKGN